MNNKITVSRSPKQGTYRIFDGSKEIYSESRNNFIVPYEFAIRLTTRQIRRGIQFTIPLDSNENKYYVKLTKWENSFLHLTIDFSEELISRLRQSHSTQRFIEFPLGDTITKKIVYPDGNESPGGIGFCLKANTVHEILEYAEKIMSELIKSLIKEN